jgi:hypothetical protein
MRIVAIACQPHEQVDVFDDPAAPRAFHELGARSGRYGDAASCGRVGKYAVPIMAMGLPSVWDGGRVTEPAEV